MKKKLKSDSKIHQKREIKDRLSKLDIEKAVAEYLRDKLGDDKAVDLLINNEAIKKEVENKEKLRADIEDAIRHNIELDIKKEVKSAIKKEEAKKELNKRRKEIEEAKKIALRYPNMEFKIPDNLPDIPSDVTLEKKSLFVPETFSVENVYDSKKFWNSSRVKKPTLSELEKYHKLALDREFNEYSEKCWVDLREKRNILLQNTDWTQLPDVTMSQKERLLYREYRSYLRDKTKDYKNNNIQTWKILSFEEFKQMNFPK